MALAASNTALILLTAQICLLFEKFLLSWLPSPPLPSYENLKPSWLHLKQDSHDLNCDLKTGSKGKIELTI